MGRDVDIIGDLALFVTRCGSERDAFFMIKCYWEGSGGGSSSEWLWKGLVTGGRRARRREEGMPPCSGLTICSDTSGPLHF